jgi:hypothetical protein
MVPRRATAGSMTPNACAELACALDRDQADLAEPAFDNLIDSAVHGTWPYRPRRVTASERSARRALLLKLAGCHAAAQRYLAAAFPRAHPSLDLSTVLDAQAPCVASMLPWATGKSATCSVKSIDFKTNE